MPQICTRSSGGSPSYLLPVCSGRHGHYGMRPLQAVVAWRHDSLDTSRHYERLRSVRRLLQVNQQTTAPNRANTSGTAIIGEILPPAEMHTLEEQPCISHRHQLTGNLTFTGIECHATVLHMRL